MSHDINTFMVNGKLPPAILQQMVDAMNRELKGPEGFEAVARFKKAMGAHDVAKENHKVSVPRKDILLS